MRALVLVLIAACGRGPTRNTLHAPTSPLAAVGAPHVSILVRNLEGLHRVWLDTANSELVDRAPSAKPLTDDAYLTIEDQHYVLHRRGQPRLVIEGVDTDHALVTSHDGTWFAAEQPRDEIAVIAVADGRVRRVPLAPRIQRDGLAFVFTRDGAALLVADRAQHYRLDLATLTHTPATRLDWTTDGAPKPTECTARGLRLEHRVDRHAQRIVLVARASTQNPEELRSLTDRVLVSSTNHPRSTGGDGAANIGKPVPGELAAIRFTPSCEHFVFSLEGRVYVGNVATGAYALLTRGVPAR